MPILYFPEDVDILEHLSESALEGRPAPAAPRSAAELRRQSAPEAEADKPVVKVSVPTN